MCENEDRPEVAFQKMFLNLGRKGKMSPERWAELIDWYAKCDDGNAKVRKQAKEFARMAAKMGCELYMGVPMGFEDVMSDDEREWIELVSEELLKRGYKP